MKKELAITVIIAIASASASFGVCQNQITTNKDSIEKLELTHQKDVDALRCQQQNQDVLLQSINNNLASLNTKVDLLVNGKLKQGE